jgi:transketolase C-terminal domain/subunit
VPSPNRFTPLRKLPPNDGVVLVVVATGVVVTVAGRFAENLKADGCRTKINSLFIR